MSTDNNILAHADDRLLEQATRCTDALKALQPKQQHQKAQLFALLYPTIVELLNKQVTQKAILEVLETQGLKLHPARFKELMAAQAVEQSAHVASDTDA